MNARPILICFALCAAALASRSVGQPPRASDLEDVVTTAFEDGRFSSFVAALSKAELTNALQGKGPFTVFAPTDDAFGKVPDEVLDELLEKKNGALLERVLTHHIVAGDLRAKRLMRFDHVITLNGQRIDFASEDEVLTVDGVEIVVTDIECSNGVLHVIDTVLMPESRSLVGVVDDTPTLATFLSSVETAGLTKWLDIEGPFTLLVPDDAAFAALPEGTLETLLKPENKEKLAALLKLHIIDGRVYADQLVRLEKVPTVHGAELPVVATDESTHIGNATISATDTEASNGVIHVIDTVLLP